MAEIKGYVGLKQSQLWDICAVICRVYVPCEANEIPRLVIGL